MCLVWRYYWPALAVSIYEAVLLASLPLFLLEDFRLPFTSNVTRSGARSLLLAIIWNINVTSLAFYGSASTEVTARKNRSRVGLGSLTSQYLNAARTRRLPRGPALRADRWVWSGAAARVKCSSSSPAGTNRKLPELTELSRTLNGRHQPHRASG